MNRLVLVCALALVVGGCTTYPIIDTYQLHDKKLSCSDIEKHMEYTQKIEEMAQSDRRITVNSIIYVTFLKKIANYMHTEEVIDATKGRKQRLVGLYEKGDC